MDRGAPLTARWIHEPRPISNHPVGLGFSHSPGRYRPGGCAFASPRFLGCRCIGEFLTRRWEFILPVFDVTSALDRGATLTARWLHEPREISNPQVKLGSAHTPGEYRPAKCAFACPGFLSCRDVEGLLIRGWNLALSGGGETSALPREVPLAARWLHESEIISNHPVGLGVSHPAGRYRPRGSAFSSLGSWSCRGMGEVLIEG